MTSRHDAKTRPATRAVSRPDDSVSNAPTRPSARAVARGTALDALLEPQRRFEVARASGLRTAPGKKGDGWTIHGAGGAPSFHVASRGGPSWKALGTKALSPERRFEVLTDNRLRAVLGLDAVFVDPATGNMERRGHGQLFDGSESKVLAITLRKRLEADGYLPQQPAPALSMARDTREVLVRAGERSVATIFPIGGERALELLSHYELAFERDAAPRERTWTFALLLLADVWGLEAERRRR